MLRERLKQAGLRFKLIILVVAVSTIPLSIMGTITFHTTDDDLVEHLETRLTDVADRLQDQADRYLLDRMNLMRGLAASVENGGDLGEAQLQAQLAVHGDFQGLAVVDRDGEPVTRVGDMGADSPRERRRWLRDTPGDPRMHLSTDGNGPAVLMAVPIHGDEHLVGRLSLSELSELITEIQIGDTGTAALFDVNDRLLAGDEASWSQRASAGGDFSGADNNPRWGVARSLSRVSDQYDLNLGVLVAQQTGELYGLVTWLWWLLWGLWVIAFLVALAIGWIYAGVLTRPLRALAEALEGISRGDTDLDHRLEIATGDEIGRTSKAFNGVMDRLDSLIQRVAKAADGIAASARHLEQQSTDMTSSTEEQRNSVEQVATAMNEMAATVQEVARNTQTAADQAAQANDAAGEGRRIVEATRESIGALAREVAQARTVIHELKGDSDNIGSILQVIEEIADQTNLLALNAAIEAARAGESGRGFAVVADEVRSLAGRTSNSTTEIKDIITRLQSGTERAVAVMDEGTHRAEASVERSREAEQSLDEIHQAVEGITDMTSQIATSSEEQRQVAEDINANVHRVNDVAASNVDSAAEVQRSVAHLEQLARELAEEVAHFRH